MVENLEHIALAGSLVANLILAITLRQARKNDARDPKTGRYIGGSRKRG